MPAGDRVAAPSTALPPWLLGAESSVAAVRGRKGAAPRRTAERLVSNRKTDAKRDEDQGKIKAAIGVSGGATNAADARTLGGYLPSSTPRKTNSASASGSRAGKCTSTSSTGSGPLARGSALP